MRTIFKNGFILAGSAEVENPHVFDNLITNDGKIEHVGNTGDKLGEDALPDSQAAVVNLKGRLVLPSFIDAHTHLLNFGASLSKLSLHACGNLHEIRSAIATRAAQDLDATRILCHGWRQFTIDFKAFASMLDGLDDRPIHIDSEDLHSVWCNYAALKELGVQDTPDPAGGKIHRDDHGNPSGLLDEAAVLKLVWPLLLRATSFGQKIEYLRTVIRAYTAAGYTGPIDMVMDTTLWEPLQHLHDTEPLPFRIAAHWIIMPSQYEKDLLAQLQKPKI